MEAKVDGEEEEEATVVGVDLQTRRSTHRNYLAFAPNAASITSDDNNGNFDSVRDGVEAKDYDKCAHEEEAEVEGEHGLDEEEDLEEQNETENDFLSETGKGAETRDGFSSTDNTAVSCPLPCINAGDDEVDLMEKHVSTPKNSDAPMDDQFIGNLKQTVSTSFNKLLPRISNKEQIGTSKAICNVEMKHEESMAEFDVERVLEKQETHDLFCPNCNSCITKRVILQRRKREIQHISSVEVVVDPGVLDNLPPESDNRDLEIVAHDSSGNITEKTGPEVFRCLSCFSIFIPTRNGFKFWPFRDNKSGQNIQNPQQSPTSVANEVPPEFGSTTATDPIGPEAAPDRAQKPEQDIIPLPMQKPPLPVQADREYVTIPILEKPVQPMISGVRPERDDVELSETEAVDGAAEADRDPGPGVLKAIIYGGLVESITSLSVVTSAVGADATTLNVLALGVANVIGGLFVIAHNLRVLKHETSTERYGEQLGRVGHFPFHATIAVVSYLVFGFMPPIVYSFSFLKSNNRDLKLVTLASSALLCIFLLAIGKAYVGRPPKSYVKTLTYYVGLGIMGSGVSFVVGDLVQVLLEKLGLFQSSYTLLMPVSEGASTKVVWSSS